MFSDLSNSQAGPSKLYSFVYEVTTSLLILNDSNPLPKRRRGSKEYLDKEMNQQEKDLFNELSLYESILDILFVNLTLSIEAKACAKSMFADAYMRMDMEFLNKTNIFQFY
jgi:hypothetical protein